MKVSASFYMLDDSLDLGYMCECPDIMEVQGQEFLILSRQKEENCKEIIFAGRIGIGMKAIAM